MDIVKRVLTICAAGAAVLIIVLIVGRKPKGPASTEHRVPVFEAVTSEGTLHSIRDFALGPAVVVFWRLHDPEGPVAVSVLDKLTREEWVASVAVNCDASSAEIAEFVKGKDFQCRIVHMGDDPDRLRQVVKLYHLDEHRLPRFLLLREKNLVAADLEGPQTYEDLRQAVVRVDLLPWITEEHE